MFMAEIERGEEFFFGEEALFDFVLLRVKNGDWTIGGQEFMEGIGDKKNILFLSLELIVMMRCYKSEL